MDTTLLRKRTSQALTAYVVAAAAYVIYSFCTDSGPMQYIIPMLDRMTTGSVQSGGSARALIALLAVPVLVLCLPLYFVYLLARRSAPDVAEAMASWAGPSRTRKDEVRSWKSILGHTGAVALAFALISALVFWTTASLPARKIYDVNLNERPTHTSHASKYVRLTGVIPDGLRLAFKREGRGERGTIAPIVAENWTPANPISYLVITRGDDSAPLSQHGRVRIPGEIHPGGDVARVAIQHYNSAGLKVDSNYEVVEWKDLPEGDYGPTDYDFAGSAIGLGCIATFLTFVILWKERSEKKRVTVVERRSVKIANRG